MHQGIGRSVLWTALIGLSIMGLSCSKKTDQAQTPSQTAPRPSAQSDRAPAQVQRLARRASRSTSFCENKAPFKLHIKYQAAQPGRPTKIHEVWAKKDESGRFFHMKKSRTSGKSDVTSLYLETDPAKHLMFLEKPGQGVSFCKDMTRSVRRRKFERGYGDIFFLQRKLHPQPGQEVEMTGGLKAANLGKTAKGGLECYLLRHGEGPSATETCISQQYCANVYSSIRGQQTQAVEISYADFPDSVFRHPGSSECD